jgi:hypothetical protein
MVLDVGNFVRLRLFPAPANAPTGIVPSSIITGFSARTRGRPTFAPAPSQYAPIDLKPRRSTGLCPNGA